MSTISFKLSREEQPGDPMSASVIKQVLMERLASSIYGMPDDPPSKTEEYFNHMVNLDLVDVNVDVGSYIQGLTRASEWTEEVATVDIILSSDYDLNERPLKRLAEDITRDNPIPNNAGSNRAKLQEFKIEPVEASGPFYYAKDVVMTSIKEIVSVYRELDDKQKARMLVEAVADKGFPINESDIEGLDAAMSVEPYMDKHPEVIMEALTSGMLRSKHKGAAEELRYELENNDMSELSLTIPEQEHESRPSLK